MISPDVRAVADAILYEGYILYPYRKSSIKNRQRWTFGGLFPRGYAERGGGDRWFLQCECLIRGGAGTRIGAAVRFLQVATRKIAKLRAPAASFDQGNPPEHEIVEALEVGGRTCTPWDEAIARDREIPPHALGELAQQPLTIDFAYEPLTVFEPLANQGQLIEGLIIRETENIRGRAVVSAQAVAKDVFRVSLRLENLTGIAAARCARREMAVALSFASTHVILTLPDGGFLSLTDPPDDLAEASRACVNEGCWPVLAGEDGTTGTIFAAPIILYDYPRIAPESDSDLFDGTEIDEILILRILTMTDAEKAEMASGDARAQRLLARLEAMTPDEMGKLHGVWRDVSGAGSAQSHPKPELASLAIKGQVLTVGDRVRLKPRKGGDAMDIVLAGKIAIVEAIERDFEDRVHVAVVVADDPGRDFGLARLPGHRFFFAPEEVERCPAAAS